MSIFGLKQDKPFVIAGPCSAESEKQVLDTAFQLASGGIKFFRAGVWKPRTKPGSFEGLGEKALPWLTRVKSETGMRVFTEVANEYHMQAVVEAGLDGVWVGARTSANPFAVQEIADVFERLHNEARDSITVLVKNPVNPDLELWLGAIERLRGAGVRDIVAIHRGFSIYGPHLYRNEPRWAIPIELQRRLPDIPLLCDPSHIGGSKSLVAPLSQQALDMGFDGLMIESHICPECALSDSAQQITPVELIKLLSQLKSPKMGWSGETLETLRRKIDEVDDELLELLARRMEIAREIGRYKRDNQMSIVQPHRYNDLMERRVKDGVSLGISSGFIRTILALIHEESVNQQLSE